MIILKINTKYKVTIAIIFDKRVYYPRKVSNAQLINEK